LLRYKDGEKERFTGEGIETLSEEQVLSHMSYSKFPYFLYERDSRATELYWTNKKVG